MTYSKKVDLEHHKAYFGKDLGMRKFFFNFSDHFKRMFVRRSVVSWRKTIKLKWKSPPPSPKTILSGEIEWGEEANLFIFSYQSGRTLRNHPFKPDSESRIVPAVWENAAEIVSCDFFLFPSWNRDFKSKQFTDINEVTFSRPRHLFWLSYT